MASLHPIRRARPQAKSQWCKPAYRGPFPLYSSFFHPSCSLDRECIPPKPTKGPFPLILRPSALLSSAFSAPLTLTVSPHKPVARLSFSVLPAGRPCRGFVASVPSAASAPSPSLVFPRSQR